MAAAVDADADHEALRHWIYAVDERERLSELTSAQPLIPGIRHTKDRPHLILNPLFRRIRELTADIEKAQEAFGMTPLSRFRLQLSYADAGQSLADLRRRAESDRQEQRRAPKVLDLEALE
ncbi:MAG: P27 family phage terminase small subunit [Dehalococcoidia bacterium]|nr:P27 family phage terminase small subunit [Dehalococcoidia bacterium]